MLPNQTFNRQQKLLLPSDYKFVFNQPIRSSDKLITILAKKNPVQNNSRLGLAVAKKSVKTAVQRNRIKRLAREFFRTNQAKIACADYVVLVRKGVEQAENQQIVQSLSKQFNYLKKQFNR
jgi:ribonuclease P protein component